MSTEEAVAGIAIGIVLSLGYLRCTEPPRPDHCAEARQLVRECRVTTEAARDAVDQSIQAVEACSTVCGELLRKCEQSASR